MKFLILILITTMVQAKTLSDVKKELIQKSEDKIVKLKKGKFNDRKIKVEETFIKCLKSNYTKDLLLKCIDTYSKEYDKIKKARLNALDAIKNQIYTRQREFSRTRNIYINIEKERTSPNQEYIKCLKRSYNLDEIKKCKESKE